MGLTSDRLSRMQVAYYLINTRCRLHLAAAAATTLFVCLLISSHLYSTVSYLTLIWGEYPSSSASRSKPQMVGRHRVILLGNHYLLLEIWHFTHRRRCLSRYCRDFAESDVMQYLLDIFTRLLNLIKTCD